MSVGEEILSALDEAANALQAAAATARRAYTAENFDESLVHREHGRFARGDGGAGDPTALAMAQMDRVRAAIPGVEITMSPELEDRIRSSNPAQDAPRADTEEIIGALDGVATGFERMSAAYPGVARGIGSIEFATIEPGVFGRYQYLGSDRTIGVGDSERNMPKIGIDIEALADHAREIELMGDVQIVSNTIPAERALTGGVSVERLTEGVTVHEFGHAVDYAMPADRLDVGHGDAVAFSNASDGHVSRYSMASQREYFAEVFAANELGFVDRLTQEDLDVLASAGVHPGTRAAATTTVEDPEPDTFDGSIVWEYAAQPRTAAFDESLHPRDRGRFTFKTDGGWDDQTREVAPRSVFDARDRYRSEDEVRVRLAAVYPNATIGHAPGFRDVMADEKDFISYIDKNSPEYDEALIESEANADRVVAVYDGLEQMAAQFPEQAARLVDITMVDGLTTRGGGMGETIHMPPEALGDRPGTRMEFALGDILNTTDVSAFSIGGKEAQDQGDMRNWSFGVAVHEFGHVLDFHAAAVEHGKEFTYNDFENARWGQSNAPKMLAAWDDEFPDHFNLAAGEVSGYAMAEPAEYAAEAFAQSRLDPRNLDPDAREIVEWMEARAAMKVGDKAPVTAAVHLSTESDGTPSISIVDFLKGDCVPVRYALGMLGPPVQASIGAGEILREIPDKFIGERRAAFDETQHPRETSGQFAYDGGPEPGKGKQDAGKKDRTPGTITKKGVVVGNGDTVKIGDKVMVRYETGLPIERFTTTGYGKVSKIDKVDGVIVKREDGTESAFKPENVFERGKEPKEHTYGSKDIKALTELAKGGFIGGQVTGFKAGGGDVRAMDALFNLVAEGHVASVGARRGYTKENFDEANVVRERGRFAKKDGGGEVLDERHVGGGWSGTEADVAYKVEPPGGVKRWAGDEPSDVREAKSVANFREHGGGVPLPTGDDWQSRYTVPIEDLSAEVTPGGSTIWYGKVAEGEPVIVYRTMAEGEMASAAAAGDTGWKSTGDYVVRSIEGDTTQFSASLGDVLPWYIERENPKTGEPWGYSEPKYAEDVIVAVDIQGLPFQTIRPPEGTVSDVTTDTVGGHTVYRLDGDFDLRAYIGAGIGIADSVPFDRVVGVYLPKSGEQPDPAAYIDSFRTVQGAIDQARDYHGRFSRNDVGDIAPELAGRLQAWSAGHPPGTMYTSMPPEALALARKTGTLDHDNGDFGFWASNTAQPEYLKDGRFLVAFTGAEPIGGGHGGDFKIKPVPVENVIDVYGDTPGESLARAAAIRSRRAYTAENFDESLVVREHGRFARKEGAGLVHEFLVDYAADKNSIGTVAGTAHVRVADEGKGEVAARLTAEQMVASRGVEPLAVHSVAVTEAVDALPTQTGVPLYDGRQIEFMDADGLALRTQPPDPFPYEKGGEIDTLSKSDNPADLDRVTQMFDANRAVERAWEEAIADELATGKISYEAAKDRWGEKYGSPLIDGIAKGLGGERWLPLPDELWHVTTNAPGVEQAGSLMTRNELDMDRAVGLGGGSSDTISFTTNRDMAERIYDAMREAQGVASGRIGVQNMIDAATAGERASRPFVTDFMHTFGQYDRRYNGASLEAAPWKPGDPYPNEIARMLESSTPDDRLDVYKAFSMWRQQAGGPEDPLFFGTDAEALAKRDPADFGIVKVTPVPGAMGVQMSSMAEWRLPTGAGVTIDKIANTASLVWRPSRFTRRGYTKENFDESKVRREGGRFAFKEPAPVEPTATAEPPRELRIAASWWSGSKKHTDRIQEDADSLMTTGKPLADPIVTGMGGTMMQAVAASPTNDGPLFRGVNGRPDRYTPGQEVAFSLGAFSEDEKWASSFAAGRTTAPSRLGPPFLFTIEPGGAKALDFATLNLKNDAALAKFNEKEWVTGGKFVVDRVEPYTTGRGLPEGQKVWLHQTEVPHAAMAGVTAAVGVLHLDPNLSGSFLSLVMDERQAAVSRFARRGYTKENFDESFVTRLHGRFAEQYGGDDTANASDYGLNYQAKYVKDPDLLAARKWNGWDAVPVTEVDPKSLVAVEDKFSRKSIDKVVSGKEPLREGYVAQVVRKNDGTEIIVDGHHRAAMASAMDTLLEVKIVDASTIRADFTRRAYTKENFDETKVRREGGRFTFKEPAAPSVEEDRGNTEAIQMTAAVAEDIMRRNDDNGSITGLPLSKDEGVKMIDDMMAKYAPEVDYQRNWGNEFVDQYAGANTQAFIARGVTETLPADHPMYNKPMVVMMVRDDSTPITVIHEMAHVLEGSWKDPAGDDGHTLQWWAKYHELLGAEGYTAAQNTLSAVGWDPTAKVDTNKAEFQ